MDIAVLLDEYGIEGTLSEKRDEFVTLCPFHHDTHPSCSINLSKGVFKCFSCDAKGDLYGFLAASSGVSRTAVKRQIEAGTETPATLSLSLALNWHKTLVKNNIAKRRLLKKGIDAATIEKYQLGLDGKRYTIPIFNKKGILINIRKYLPDAKQNKTISMKGYGGATLYPIESLDKEIIVITEGEMKALLLCKMKYNGITSTGGGKSWSKDWLSFFKDKTIILIFDIDETGTISATRIAQILYVVTKKIKIILLPLNKKTYPKGDITNFFIDEKRTKKELDELIKKTAYWIPELPQETLDSTIYKTHLASSTKAEYYYKVVSTKVMVSAKDTSPYMIPHKCKVSCLRSESYCAYCAVFDKKEFTIDRADPAILEMINVSVNVLANALKKAAKIPNVCKTCSFKVVDSINIEELRLIPQLEITYTDSRHVVRQGYYIGHGIETNISYDIKARVCPCPRTQHAVLLIYEAKTTTDNITSFKIKDTKVLKIFQPKSWTKEALSAHIDLIYADLEANVTRIYKRFFLHLFYDLIYHSVLYLIFQDRVVKGWAEGLVIGDSGQGKSETILQLQQHYGLGEKIDIKSSSIAGIIGGLQEMGKRWFITWGIIPLNDKRLVVLEEIKGAHPEIIAKLTEMRSSGIAEISKVEKARANARTRLIWISNPRSDKQILTYNFGVEAVKELIGNLEDIRRFDLAMLISTEDIDKKWLNIQKKERPTAKHIFTSNLCQQLILWGWSRTEKQVTFTEDATNEILNIAKQMGRKFSSMIPLVEMADQKLKLARLSAALAVRTFSTDRGISVIVRKCHVEYIKDFLYDLYSSPACAYTDFSKMVKGEQQLHEEDVIIKEIKNLPYARDTVRSLLEVDILSVFDIADWTEMDLDMCRSFISFLVRKNAIKRQKKGYIKTPAFIAILKKLQLEKLDNLTRYEKIKDEEF